MRRLLHRALLEDGAGAGVSPVFVPQPFTCHPERSEGAVSLLLSPALGDEGDGFFGFASE